MSGLTGPAGFSDEQTTRSKAPFEEDLPPTLPVTTLKQMP
jgi:hypothetical protein